jgi:hypothetical protein
MSSKENKIITIKGSEFQVPPGGSLGLLALGNIGVRAWRRAQKEWKEKEGKERRDGKE